MVWYGLVACMYNVYHRVVEIFVFTTKKLKNSDPQNIRGNQQTNRLKYTTLYTSNSLNGKLTSFLC